MKKMLKLLAVAAMVACGLMMSGCTEEEINAAFGPDYTWCQTSYDTDKDGTADMFVAVIYCPEAVSSSKTGAPYLKSGETIKAGITVVTWATVSIPAVGLTGGTYAVKEYANGESADGIKGSKAGFAAIYRGKADFRNVDNQFECTTSSPLAPSPLTNSPGVFVPLSGDALKNLNWKSMLATYLLR